MGKSPNHPRWNTKARTITIEEHSHVVPSEPHILEAGVNGEIHFGNATLPKGNPVVKMRSIGVSRLFEQRDVHLEETDSSLVL